MLKISLINGKVDTYVCIDCNRIITSNSDSCNGGYWVYNGYNSNWSESRIKL